MVIFLLVIIFLLTAFLYFGLFYSIFLSVPSLSSRKKVINKILENVDFSSCQKFYDLGSGSGKMIFQVAKKYPKIECVGIERNPAVYLLALARNVFLKNKVKYIRKSFFDVDLQDADIIYAYLFPGFMEPLHQKFQKELKRGAVVISNSFPIESKNPSKVIGEKGNSFGPIYIYQY